ncbi:MAG: AI-2E family transporter [Clostridium sp.]
MKFLKKHRSIVVSVLTILAILLVILTYVYFAPFRDTVNLVLVGFIIAYALRPLSQYISTKLNIKLRTSAMIIIALIFIGIGLIIYIFTPIIIQESSNFGDMLDNVDVYVEQLISSLGLSDVEFVNNIYSQVNEQLNSFLVNLTPMIIENISSVLGSLMSLAVIPVVSYYFLVDGEFLYNKALLILPTEKRIVFRRIFKNVDKVISRYIVSQFLLSFIIAILTTVVLMIFKVKFALVLGIINGVFNIIPYFGPIFGMIPAIIVAFIQSPSTAIWTAASIFAIQQIEGNILSPKITADSTDMHPITIIILLIIGEKIGGIVGMIIIVPIGVMIKVIYDDINYYLF